MNELPLRDIHLPEAINWWPPAIGWWLLPVLIILIIFVTYKFIIYKQLTKKVNYKKIAINELDILRADFKNKTNSVEFIRSISALLRRIALSYLPRENIASLTGRKWINQLNCLGENAVFTNEIGLLLEQAPYMEQCEYNHDELITICELWIKALPETNDMKTRTGDSL